MSYKLRYSQEALDDMDRMWSEVWEASQDFDIADKYLDDLRARIRMKTDFPKSGSPLSYMGEFTGIYMVFFKEYIAFYRIRADIVEVSRVLFARSDYMKTLFGRSEYIMKEDDTPNPLLRKK